RTESWEKDGQKYERPALMIRTIGPNLAFATASPQKATQGSQDRRGQAQQPQQRAPQDDPWNTATPARPGGGYQGRGEEPPF
ncbi:hypothetical protein ACOS9C_26715, partial [Escherichia coli]